MLNAKSWTYHNLCHPKLDLRVTALAASGCSLSYKMHELDVPTMILSDHRDRNRRQWFCTLMNRRVPRVRYGGIIVGTGVQCNVLKLKTISQYHTCTPYGV